MQTKTIFTSIIICSFVLYAFAGNNFYNKEVNIIPKPLKVEIAEGSFIISGDIKVVVNYENKEAIKIAKDFVKIINNAKYFNIGVKKAKVGETNPKKLIRFNLSGDKEKYGNEGYSLKVTENGINIEAHQPNGLFYAVQTIYQLLPYQFYSGESIGSIELSIQCVSVFDKPRFTWRGNMLDPSRHFISVDYIKQNLDYLANLKMNKFHWHLTDDQGWRIEIKSYPKLTEVGAWRVDRNKETEWHGRKEQQGDEIASYGGYYSQEQIKDIIQYAAERYIEIIPEIDIPGHSRAAIAAYPEISCDESDYKVATGGIMSNNTYCPGKEITFEFTEKMLNEVMDLFPSKYMHIGGDECNKDAWKICDNCQKRIKDNKLKDEYELQSYFIKRVEKIINTRGKYMIGWDEILEGGLAPNATVMSWRGIEGGVTAAKAGHEVVMSPWGFCYLDLRQGDPKIEPDYGYGMLLLSTAYSYNPIPEGFTAEEAKLILGVQGNLWGESMQKPYDHNYMLFPRLFAIAEVGWTDVERKDYKDFINRTEYALNRLDAMHVNYAPSMYNIIVGHEGSLLASYLKLTLSTDAESADIYYTLDSTEPTLKSTLYTKSFPILKSTIIRARAFRNGIAVGRFYYKKINYHKAAGKKVKFYTKPNGKYNTSDICLTDCFRGTLDNSKEHWVAFRESNMDIEIDLGKNESINKITASLLHSTRAWVFLPKDITFLISTDGKNYTTVGSLDYSKEIDQPGRYLIDSMVKFEKVQARYIRIKAKNIINNPEWHNTPRGKSWMFIDEVIVE